MDNKVLEDIKNYAIQRLNHEYGYCGLAESPSMALINSSGDNVDITIHIYGWRAEIKQSGAAFTR